MSSRLSLMYIKVLLPFVSSYASTPLTQCYCQAELDKRRKYDELIREVERWTFTPSIFPHQVEWAPQQRLFIDAFLLWFRRRGVVPTVRWYRIKLCFSLLRSAVMCLQGSRCRHHRHNLNDPAIDLACSESRVGPEWLLNSYTIFWCNCHYTVLLHKKF